MAIDDLESVPLRANDPETASSQHGCEQLPAKKAEAASKEAFVEEARAAIERIDDELRALSAQPGSPERDRARTKLQNELVKWQNDRAFESRRLSRLIDEIHDLESRCIRQA